MNGYELCGRLEGDTNEQKKKKVVRVCGER